MQLTGFHHLTAVTADAPGNRDFYTRTLGLRLVKKTVNQDDVSAYHLFYADGKGSPGTDITFFDWPVGRERRGTRSIVRTGFRVQNGAAIEYWAKRLHDAKIVTVPVQDRGGFARLDFEDPEGQRLSLVTDEKSSAANAWEKSPVPAEFQIRGLGSVAISVPDLDLTRRTLVEVMQMREKGTFDNTTVFEMGGGGPSAQLHVIAEPGATPARLGAGGAHHVAFRVPTYEEYDRWNERLAELGVRSSGPVDRFYFRSLYFREPNGVLFELATDGPGFAADEPADQLGEHLSLPPFLEGRRKQIEANLKPL